MAHSSGALLYNLLERGITPRQIMTRDAFENAITVVMAMGGSTNAVLHLLAIAHEAEVELNIDDFDEISRRTPYITDLRPSGRFVMSDMDKSGGVPVVMKQLLDAGLLHGDALTVTGKTIAENLDDLDIPEPDSRVIHPISSPRSPTGGLVILKGNLAPEGAVIKVSGTKHTAHEGPARVFNGERPAFDAIVNGEIKDGDVVVVRYEGPKGGPGMQEMLAVTGAIIRRGSWRLDDAPDGRALLRRFARPVHRTCGSGGGCLAAPSPCFKTATSCPSMRRPEISVYNSQKTNLRSAAQSGRRRRRTTTGAFSPSTRSWCRRHRWAR